MRTNLVNFLRKITLCAFTAVACAFGSSVRAHDLPNFIPYHELGADCLGLRAPAGRPAPNPAAPKVIAQPVAAIAPAARPLTCPIKDAYAQVQHLFSDIDPQASLRNAVTNIQQTAEQFLSGAKSCISAIDDLSLVANLPEDAPPPSPRLDRDISPAQPISAPSMPLVARNYVEDYLPYDMCIRDWQFGRYSYRGLSRTAHLSPAVAEVSNSTLLARSFPEETVVIGPVNRQQALNYKHAEVVSQTLRSIETYQCEVCSELCSFAAANEFGSYLARSWSDMHVAVGETLAAHLTTPASNRQPFFTEPQFVIYEVAGKHFVLPVERALIWERARGLESQPSHAVEHVVASPISSGTEVDFESDLLSFASRSLASFGTRCLDLSKQLDSLKNQRVAGRAAGDVR